MTTRGDEKLARNIPNLFAAPLQALSSTRKVANHPLSQGQRLRAIIRWTRLRAAMLLVPTKQIAIPYVNGAILNWPIAATSVGICAKYGLGEFADMAFCLHVLRRHDLFCDLGANAGVYTILASRGVGCSVLAVEPVPRTFDLLMQNVYANGVSERVDARNVGVGRTPAKLAFSSSLWSYNHVVAESGNDAVQRDVLPLDSLLDGRAPKTIKIDVEGFEEEVLAGADKTLDSESLQAIVVEIAGSHLKRYGSSAQAVEAMILSKGFVGPFWYRPETRELIRPGAAAPKKYNHIFIRDLAFVTERLSTAPRFEINGAFI